MINIVNLKKSVEIMYTFEGSRFNMSGSTFIMSPINVSYVFKNDLGVPLEVQVNQDVNTAVQTLINYVPLKGTAFLGSKDVKKVTIQIAQEDNSYKSKLASTFFIIGIYQAIYGGCTESYFPTESPFNFYDPVEFEWYSEDDKFLEDIDNGLARYGNISAEHWVTHTSFIKKRHDEFLEAEKLRIKPAEDKPEVKEEEPPKPKRRGGRKKKANTEDFMKTLQDTSPAESPSEDNPISLPTDPENHEPYDNMSISELADHIIMEASKEEEDS